tara:strand:- start:7387 stop:7557 length:171 start_codon:yes stop_codon:yes gene_type:complete
MIKHNVKQSEEFKKQVSILGHIVDNSSLKKKDPKLTKKIDTEKLFIKNKNKTKKKN